MGWSDTVSGLDLKELLVLGLKSRRRRGSFISMWQKGDVFIRIGWFAKNCKDSNSKHVAQGT